MQLDKIRFEVRLEDLKRQADVYRQQYNMTLGAIAECEFWLAKLNEGSEGGSASLSSQEK